MSIAESAVARSAASPEPSPSRGRATAGPGGAGSDDAGSGVRLVHRPARSTAPARPAETTTIRRPPLVGEESSGGSGLLGLIPMLGAAGSMTVMMLFRDSPFAAVGALMMIVTVVGAVVMLVSQRGRAGRRRKTLRDGYLDYLEERRHQLLEDERAHRTAARACDPLPEALVDVVSDPHRLWERRRGHEDFLRVRLGTGTAPVRQLALEGGEESPGERPDPHLSQELDTLVRRFRAAPDVPLLVDLARHDTVSIIGDASFGQQVLRALTLSAAALHSPEDLQLAAAVPPALREDWLWFSRLPHVLDQRRPTARGPLNRVAPSSAALRDLLDEEIRARHQRHAEVRRTTLSTRPAVAQPRLLMLDLAHGGAASAPSLPDPTLRPGDLAITSLHLVAAQHQEPEEVSLRIVQTPDGLRLEDCAADPLDPEITRGALNPVPEAVADGVARMLAPLRLSPDSREHDEDLDRRRFTAHLGIRDVDAHDVDRLWRPRTPPDFLTVPIGVDDRGQPVRLDLKESAQHGMGPHGLCVGATGSGKSELLRTLVTGLAVTHPPEELSMVLVDYKGGATFAPFAELPHVSGLITNLNDDATLIDRIHASLEGEVLRRQEVLKDAGDFASIGEYRAHRAERAAAGEELEPLPHLFVIIDEFGELLSARPDFIDLFMSIGRIGRSIGVHLLLSSQRIETGKLRGLETHLSYRIGLRTLSEGESRTVLETPDAFHLPPQPGYGYLKVDTTTYTRFKAGYVSGPLSAETDAEEEVETEEELPVLADGFYAQDAVHDAAARAAAERARGAEDASRSSGSVGAGDSGTSSGAEDSPGGTSPTAPTVLSTLVAAMRDRPRPIAPIWLPPLPDAVSLDRTVEGDLRAARRRPMQVPVGLLDDPANQWQGPWTLDLARAGGHVAVLGGPSSGTSTALRTIGLSLAATHSVREVALYGIDLGGAGLLPLRDLPHSAGMAARTSRETIRRTIEELSDILDERERLFEEQEIDTLATMRRRHAAGELPELHAADVVLLLDGWGSLQQEHAELAEQVHDVLSRGGGYGVHVVAAATRWNEVRIAQQSFFGTRLELRLGEPAESAHGRRVAEQVPADRPGRGLNHDRLIGQLALPRLDGAAEIDSLNQGQQDAAATVREQEPEPVARRVQVLPQILPLDQFPAPARRGQVPFGLIERTSTPKHLDLLGAEPNLLVLGDESSGKSSLLGTLAQSLIERHTPEELVFAVFDPRRGLEGVIPESYLGGTATSPQLAEGLAGGVARELRARVPEDPAAASADGGAEGPRVVLLVDDYDVLTAGGRSPMHPFSELLPLGPDIGLNVLAARRVRGAMRGMHDPFLTAVRETGGATFLMDGDRAEGALVDGMRASRMPPGRGLFLHGGRPPRTVQTVHRG
ncbi:type VII secretion protein EccCa [Nesterenkonia halobia]|uniref:Type VII secretion protein EccC n=1 Tax=Nesterenkonia halobia TaxID=37922 RepID=A0ABP6RG40_9MICC